MALTRRISILSTILVLVSHWLVGFTRASSSTTTQVPNCGALTDPANGSVAYSSGTTYLSLATFSCDTGYTLTGNKTRTCQADKSWNNTEPTCNINDCDELTNPTNGSVGYSSGTTYLSMAIFSCDTGYTLTGDTTRTCQADMSWNNSYPTCNINECGSLKHLANGSIGYSSGTTYLSVATFSCDTGYTLIGDTTRTCQADRSWNNSDPTCNINDCGALTDPANGSVAYSSGTTYLSLATFSCDTGYTLTGNKTRTCQADKSWNNTEPTCNINDCGELTNPTNGSVGYSSGTTYLSVATFSCDTGYTRTGKTTRTCQADMSWNNSDPTCKINECGSLTNPANGSIGYSSGTTYLSVATFSCDTGYTLTGNTTRTCQADRSWNNSDSTCNINDCGALTNPANGSLAYSSGTTYMSSATFSCDTGYTLTGDKTRTCQANKSWNNTEPTCTINDCGALTNPANGSVTYSSGTTYLSVATFSCDTGYTLTGDTTRTCQANRSWNNSDSACNINDCSSLTAPADGSVAYSSGTTYLSVATFRCDTGYTLTGDTTRTCQAERLWDNSNSTCNINDCGSLDNPTHGSVAYTSTTYQSEAIYSCNQGYSPIGDTTRECQHDGNWSNTSLVCQITEVSLGQPCNISMNVCEVKHARCNDSYVCACYDNFYEDTQTPIVNSSCLPKIPLGENCTTTIMCNDSNAKCSDSICVCKDTYYNDTRETCKQKRPPEVKIISQTDWGINLSVTGRNALKECFLVHKSNEIIRTDQLECNCFNSSRKPNSVTCTYMYNVDIQPETCYNLTIIAVDKGTLDNYSKTTLEACTKPVAVTSFQLVKNYAKALDVSWNFIGNASVFNVIDLKNNYTKNITRNTTSSSDTSTYYATIGVLSPATIYQFIMTACANNVCGKESDTVEMKTLPEKPESCNATLLSSSSIRLYWSTVSSTFTQYKIIYKDCPSGCPTSSHDTSTYIVQYLYGNTEYEFNISTVWNYNFTSEPCRVVARTAPTAPQSIVFDNYTETSLNVLWTPGDDNTVGIRYVVQLLGDKNFSENMTDTTYAFKNLTSGTLYNASVTAYYEKGDNETSKELKSGTKTNWTYTKPDALQSITVTVAHQTNISMKIRSENDRFTSFRIVVQPSLPNDSYCSGIPLPKFNDSVNITCYQLTPMTEYTINGYTQAEEIQSSPIHNDTNTAPETPVAYISHVNTNTISVNLSVETNKPLDYFYYVHSGESVDGTKTNINDTKNSSVFPISGLTPGTEYTIEIYARFNEWQCDSPNILSNYTVPSIVENVSVVAETSTSLNISWAKGEGSYEYCIVDYDCHSPDKGRLNETRDNSKGLSVLRNDLTPGTTCNVSITPHAGVQTGQVQFQSNVESTYEKAPMAVSALQVNSVVDISDQLQVTWSEPSEKNGIIRKYIIQVTSKNSCIKQYYFNCSDCANNAPQTCEPPDNKTKSDGGCSISYPMYNSSQTKFNFVLHGLQAFTRYAVQVSAFTRCEGSSKTNESTTDEDIPGVPIPTSLTSPTASSLLIEWIPPKNPNGNITEYMVVYEYHEQECRGQGISRTVNETLKAETGVDNITHTIQSLYSAWNYAVWIQASTSKGFGNASESEQFTTLESKPGTIDTANITGSAEAFNISIQWLPPCVSNGEIQYYNLSWQNLDIPTDSGTNSSDTTNITFTNILPFRNYTIKIAAVNNASQGNFTEEYKIRSKIAKPYAPMEVNMSALNSTAIRVSWKRPLPELYTGPTWYTAHALDSNNKTTYTRYADGFNATECTIANLDQYWNYSVSVYVTTGDSNNTSLETKSNETKTITTFQDKPGPVLNVTAYPEGDVTKQRSITVKWQPPIQRDLNGILTKYVITYIYINRSLDNTEETEPDTEEMVLKTNIEPGSYMIMVFAATEIGNGPNETAQHQIIVNPGAPIKPVETPDNTIIRQASNAKLDSKREIAVSLDRQGFLCNSSNGIPTMWGLIVAQESRATDSSFFGSKANFTERLQTYKRWIDVKDTGDIDPYRATDADWTPSCYNIRKRSSDSSQAATQLPLDFVVGKDKDCKGKTSGNCNGQLPPGRSYRVKTFVCTDGGCTESDYSPPIKTERYEPPVSASDPTVPIVAGVISALVVIACILIVVFLKRRQTLCFTKNIEEPPFDQPQIELKGTSRFRPIVVKLVDFPSYVDVLHRDSGLLFADGFRMLKEQSPVHPTTVAETQACRPKTRYTNILPFDHSRVKILPLDDEDGSDFINANYIPGYTSRREYIATQGPLPATKDDFWRMIWEQNVDIIVMLTRCIEKGKRKCDEYWPEVVQEPVYSGDLIVNVQSESVLSDYIIRVIELKLKKETRVIRQFSYLKWPDMGSPDDSSMLLNFVKTVRQFVNPGNSGPMVVHCSAGVGRTGTFIAVDRLLQHIRDHDDVDIYSVILDMRNQRCNMVQTEDQFVYIYECIRDFITTDEEEEEEEEEEEHLYANTAMGQNIYENTAFQHE